MTKRTRTFGRALSSLAAPLLAVSIASSCGGKGGGTSSTGTTSVGDTSTGAGGQGGQGGAASTATTAASSSASGAGGQGGTGNVEPTCAADPDCVNDPKGKVCDPQTGGCVACLPTNDVCVKGQFCDPATNTCKVGCTDNSDCMGGMDLFCDTTTNSCVGCVIDTDCPVGSICFVANKVCVPGCSATQGCPMPQSCCGVTCFDLTTNTNHCGGCDTKCTIPDHAAATCISSVCGMGMCEQGFANCDGDTQTGCEQNTLQDGPCACAPGSTQACYQGGPGTKNVGACVAGTQTCDAAGIAWGPCTGQVLPKPEVCGNLIDDDCDGVVDNVSDADGDGWTTCNGDCCDTPGPGCSNPAQVNPGAFEVLGNGVDDDCDPSTSDTVAPAACAPAQKFATVTAADVAAAMDICQTTTANAPLSMKKWGLITSTQLLASGSIPSAVDLGNMQNWQTAILTNYGNGGIVPHKGPTMAGISSGKMRDQTDVGFVAPNGGSAFSSSSNAPAAYLAQHGAALPSSAGCSGSCPAGAGANDSVNVRMSIRVPTNAKSFSYDFRFFSAEYWTFQCTTFNDFYLAILQSGAPGIPADKNISFDSNNNPVSVNNGFFQVCIPKGCNICPSGAGELGGTGMQLANTGGGTTWLTTDAPIIPGETMQLELMVFDVSDHVLDSLSLLDNFRWNLQTSVVTTHM